MSVVQTRPRITGVAIASCSAASGLAQAQRLVAGNAATLQGVGAAVTSIDVQPFAALEASLAAKSSRHLLSESVAASKAHAAALLAACRLDSPDALDAHVEKLAEASTPEAALVAHDALIQAASVQHHRAFVSTLAGACARAAMTVGFVSVETDVAADGTIRVVSTNESGQSLVSEIATAADGEPQLATEVVGVHDGSCHGLLDQFDEALQAEGVRSAAPTRRETGGAALLETARLVARRSLHPRSKNPAPTATNSSKRRRGRTQGRTTQR